MLAEALQIDVNMILAIGFGTVVSALAWLIKREINRSDSTMKLMSKRLNRNCRRVKRIETALRELIIAGGGSVPPIIEDPEEDEDIESD